MVFVSINMALIFLAPRVGYFAHMDLKKSEMFFKSMPTSSVAIIVLFWASLIQNITKMAKMNVFLKEISSLGSYKPNL